MSIVEKIKDIEKEIGRTQINKATMSHLCSLRARLAKLRTELLAPPKGGSADAVGFDVEKVGDARVALIGFPSVGKSTILRCVFSRTHKPMFPHMSHPPFFVYIPPACFQYVYDYKVGGCLVRVHDADVYSWGESFFLSHPFFPICVTIAFFPISHLFISCFF